MAVSGSQDTRGAVSYRQTQGKKVRTNKRPPYLATGMDPSGHNARRNGEQRRVKKGGHIKYLQVKGKPKNEDFFVVSNPPLADWRPSSS